MGLWKEPGHEIDGTDRHSDAEDDTGQHPLGIAFTKGKHQPADDNGHQTKTSGDWPGE